MRVAYELCCGLATDFDPLFSQARGQIALPLLHLRTLNPHVVGALQQLGSETGGRGGICAPRQIKPMVSAASGGHGHEGGRALCVGVSAFAFQVGEWLNNSHPIK